MEHAGRTGRVWPQDLPELVPFMPLVLSVWVDGVLSAAELAALRAHVDAQGWLTPEGRTTLSAWMDPHDPPAATELQSLGEHIESTNLTPYPAATSSLTDLGLALWKAAGAEKCCWSEPTAVEGLRALEDSLDILGAEAARAMTGATSQRAAPEPAAPELQPMPATIKVNVIIKTACLPRLMSIVLLVGTS